MEAGREAEVVDVFSSWLRDQGWEVETEVQLADVVAQRASERLVAEVKGTTTSPGLDVDTMYGQLLRRMDGTSATSYAVVVPEGLTTAALRVHQSVRRRLAIRVFSVDMDDNVTEH